MAEVTSISAFIPFLRVTNYFLSDRTLSMLEGGRRIFVGFMKCFRHILMGHEIFFKIFDGPRNIFLCSIFVILFFKLKRLEHKISKIAMKEI